MSAGADGGTIALGVVVVLFDDEAGTRGGGNELPAARVRDGQCPGETLVALISTLVPKTLDSTDSGTMNAHNGPNSSSGSDPMVTTS